MQRFTNSIFKTNLFTIKEEKYEEKICNKPPSIKKKMKKVKDIKIEKINHDSKGKKCKVVKVWKY